MALCKEGQFLLSLLWNAVFRKRRSLTKCQISTQESNWKLHLNNTSWENRRRIWKNCSQLNASWDISFPTFAPIAITVISFPLALINIVLASTLIALVAVNHLTSVATAVKARDHNKKFQGMKQLKLISFQQMVNGPSLHINFEILPWKTRLATSLENFNAVRVFKDPCFF